MAGYAGRHGGVVTFVAFPPVPRRREPPAAPEPAPPPREQPDGKDVGDVE